MGSNTHIDRAAFPLPDQPSSSIDKCSLLLTHTKRRSGSTRLQPRSAGFTYDRELEESNLMDEFLEARILNKRICEELLRGPQNAPQENRPSPEHRKQSIRTVFNSRSKRKSRNEDNKMPVATHKTSDGRKYGQILSEQIYDTSSNASTYQINRHRRCRTPSTSSSQQRHATTSSDIVRHVSSAIRQVNGTKQPMSERSAHNSLGNGEAEHRLPLYQAAITPNPTSESLENKFLTDRPIEGNTAAGRNEEIPASLLKKSTTDDSLGLLRRFSEILSRSETANLGADASQGPEAEHQPRVRDFAANNSIPFSHACAAMQCRSRGPIKVTGKQTDEPVTLGRPFDGASCRGQPANRLGQSANSIVLPPLAFRDPAKSPLEPPLAVTQEQIPRTKESPMINYHSKAPSVVSAESTAEEIQSDASSGVVFNAESAVFVKVPPQPGPAPLTPLPSLPERLNNFAAATPKASQSTRNLASPENSPPRVPPQKSPAGSQYKLYPSVDSSPRKQSGSPMRMDAATEVVTRLLPPLRSKRRGSSFPRSGSLPASMSDDSGEWNKERVDKTTQKKLRDLGRMRSQKATIAEVEPVARDVVSGKTYNEGVRAPPNSMDSYNSETFPVKHSPQASQVSNLNALTPLQYRDSSTLSQKLSPIIVVAEQEPISRRQQSPSPNSHVSRDNIDEPTEDSKIDGSHPLLPHLLSPALQDPDDKSTERPASVLSVPAPRPLASQKTTPHLPPPSRKLSHHLLHHSMHEMSGLEARLSAIERKNAMLEKALLAVLNTSVAFDGSLGLEEIEAASSGLSGRYCGRFDGTSGLESLHVGLEHLMPLHNGSPSTRLSATSST